MFQNRTPTENSQKCGEISTEPHFFRDAKIWKNLKKTWIKCNSLGTISKEKTQWFWLVKWLIAGYLLAYQNHTETTLRIKSSPSTTHKKYSAILGGEWNQVQRFETTTNMLQRWRCFFCDRPQKLRLKPICKDTKAFLAWYLHQQ